MTRRHAIVHVLVGLVLLVILVLFTGWIAAIPLPQSLADFVSQQHTLAIWVSQLLSHFLPVLLMCFVFGVLAFRLLREASGRAVAWISAAVLVPLCGLQIAVMLLHGSGAAGLANQFGNPIFWFSIVPIPLGLWLASRLRVASR